MGLTAGAHLGPYEILAPLGAGGMGQVYKARDTRLDRIVAIKILRDESPVDPARRARFEREAHAVAALNHPHICQLFDVGEVASLESQVASPEPVRFLVMEYLEGQTLEERLVRGPLPMPDVLRIAIELAGALDHAHRRGLIHRDLKPGNVMITKTGAKLLDFGISKLQAKPDLLALATVTAGAAPITAEGAVLGTYPYMAPEQLAGREADARSDIFAFGAMLYEMATGHRAFEGTTAATVIGAILHKDPPAVSTLQSLAPPGLDRLVARCLAKDPDDRWQTARDLMLELKWLAEPVSAAADPEVRGHRANTKWMRVMFAALATLVVTGAAFTLGHARHVPPDDPVVRVTFSPPDGLTLGQVGARGAVAVSPDGRRLAFVATGTDGRKLLWIRPLDSLDAQALPETDGAVFPFWSPDSRALGFFAQGKLKKIQVAGGPPQVLCDAVQPRGGTWGAGNAIVFSAGAGYELYSVPAGGGVANALAADGFNQERVQPSFLPDGRHFVYFGRPQSFGTYVASVDSPGATLVLKDHVSPAYAAGYLMTLKGTSTGSASMTLLAQPFDAERREVTGAAEAVATQIYYDSLFALGEFSVSQTGTLVYGTAKVRTTQLAWFDRVGKPLGEVGSSGAFSQPALSPDERTIVVQRIDPETQDMDLWSIDIARRLETRVTSAGNVNFDAVWSPDGSRIAFASARIGPPNVYVKATNGGTETLLFESSLVSQTTDWSRDGRYIIYASQHPKTGWDLMRFSMSGADAQGKPEPVLQSAFNEHYGRVSPDGRWIAFMSDESGTTEVYVQGFSSPAAKQRISTSGGREPTWRGDGRELFYVADDDMMMAVAMKPGAGIQPGGATPLFKTRLSRNFRFELSYAVSRDGSRFLINTITDEAPTIPTKIVFNWPAGIGK
jgi:Tol biopolymer transport system component